jgi:hypothetical protein
VRRYNARSIEKAKMMQNKYVGDVGDFGKFQLFRFLFEHEDSPLYGKALAQIWFMHDGKGERNGDGCYIDYFERMGGTDAYLEQSLMQLLMREKREVEELERLRLLNNARFFYDMVPKNLEDRYLWLNKALTFALHTPVVAVAPDNGMALRCKRDEERFELLDLEAHYRQKVYAHKYIFIDEVDYFFKLPHLEILVLYQHLGRCMSHEKQTRVLLEALRKRYGYVVAVKHRPYSPRLFFFICKSAVIEESVRYRLLTLCERFSSFWEAKF